VCLPCTYLLTYLLDGIDNLAYLDRWVCLPYLYLLTCLLT